MLAYEYTHSIKKEAMRCRGSPGEKKEPNENHGGVYHELGKTLFGDNGNSKSMFFKRVAIDELSGRIL